MILPTTAALCALFMLAEVVEPPAEPASVPVVQIADNSLTSEEVSAGWISLFDGETLYGWRPASQADWKVVDQSIQVTSGEVGLLRTTTQFGDYQLKLDFKAAKGTNSGVFLRTSPTPDSPTYDCYELNIAPMNNSFPTGSFVGRKKVNVECADDVWHTFDITMLGGQMNVKLDGEEVLDFQHEFHLGTGFIGLQHNEGKIQFKNIKLKPLSLQSMFNGKDLTGWKLYSKEKYPDMTTKFAVSDEGVLTVKDGPGQLETEKSYGNFVLQLDAMTHAASLNSGIFFRCIPGDKMMGYESQIQNGFKNGDRTDPEDSGTGAIFRRTKARKVVANDLEWLTKTLIVEGPHIAVWVNGYQVTDWTDKRKPDENPRRGLRTEAGTIMIQGHDPTTDFSFRNFKGAESPQRWPSKRK